VSDPIAVVTAFDKCILVALRRCYKQTVDLEISDDINIAWCYRELVIFTELSIE
jgi:hypothetical protein